MFGQKRKSCGISILAEAATSVKQRKIYHVKEHVTQQHNMNTYIDTTIVSIRNILICICKVFNEVDANQKYSTILTNLLVKGGGISAALLSKNQYKKYALSVKSYVYDHIALLLVKNITFKRFLFQLLDEDVMKRTMGLNILLSNLTAPIFAILNASGESILEILHEGAKQKRETKTKNPSLLTFKKHQITKEEEEIVIDPLAFRNENITMSTTAIEALMIEKSNLAHEDLSEELIANFSHSWKMSNLSSSSNLCFQQLLKHLKVPWLIRQTFTSLISEFSVTVDHMQNMSFARHAGCDDATFSLRCSGPVHQISIPCISRAFSWACGARISKAKYTFEGIQNDTMHFTCNLPSLQKRLTIIATVVESNTLTMMWQLHSITDQGEYGSLICTATANYTKL